VGADGQCHTLVAFPLAKNPSSHFTGVFMGPRVGLDRCRNSCSPLGFNLQTVQSIASWCTDSAFPAHTEVHIHIHTYMLVGSCQAQVYQYLSVSPYSITTLLFHMFGMQLLWWRFNPLNAELNPICHLLALLGAYHILHVSRIRVKPNRKTSLFAADFKK
jgi:hypothetical protein